MTAAAMNVRSPSTWQTTVCQSRKRPFLRYEVDHFRVGGCM